MTRLAPILLWLVLMAPAHAFDLQGHRGARGLAPENTLEAFALALSIGVTTLELDIAMTRDGVLVAENRINNSLEAKVNQNHVYVKVNEEDAAKPITGVVVQVRTKGGVTDINLAHDIEKEIALAMVR